MYDVRFLKDNTVFGYSCEVYKPGLESLGRTASWIESGLPSIVPMYLYLKKL